MVKRHILSKIPLKQFLKFLEYTTLYHPYTSGLFFFRAGTDHCISLVELSRLFLGTILKANSNLRILVARSRWELDTVR